MRSSSVKRANELQNRINPQGNQACPCPKTSIYTLRIVVCFAETNMQSSMKASWNQVWFLNFVDVSLCTRNVIISVCQALQSNFQVPSEVIQGQTSASRTSHVIVSLIHNDGSYTSRYCLSYERSSFVRWPLKKCQAYHFSVIGWGKGGVSFGQMISEI